MLTFFNSYLTHLAMCKARYTSSMRTVLLNQVKLPARHAEENRSQFESFSNSSSCSSSSGIRALWDYGMATLACLVAISIRPIEK